MATIITFSHFKGGTGKTTSCINVAGFLAKRGKKVLAVDLDPQGNLTSGLGIDKKTLNYSMYDVMKKNAGIKSVILKTGAENVHIAPANLNLIRATVRKYRSREEAEILKNALRSCGRFYDYILIDTPPSNGHFIVNGAVAADFIVLVLDPGIFALEAMESFGKILEEYNKRNNLKINIGMAIITKCQRQIFPLFSGDYSKDISNEVAEITGKKVFMVPYSSVVIESQIKGLPVSHTRPYSAVGRAYYNITQEILNANAVNEIKND